MINRAHLHVIAKRRSALHGNHPHYSEDAEFKGLLGEAVVGAMIGAPIDESDRLGGDRGIDLIKAGLAIDVKTADKPYYLLVEENHVFANIYVLCHYIAESLGSDEPIAIALGWEWGMHMEQCPVKPWGFKKVSHYLAQKYLKPMDELLPILGLERFGMVQYE